MIKHYLSAVILGLFTWCITYSIPSYAEFIEGSAALSSVVPHIPEPLLFDLVRPLGAKKRGIRSEYIGAKTFKRRYCGMGARD